MNNRFKGFWPCLLTAVGLTVVGTQLFGYNVLELDPGDTAARLLRAVGYIGGLLLTVFLGLWYFSALINRNQVFNGRVFVTAISYSLLVTFYFTPASLGNSLQNLDWLISGVGNLVLVVSPICTLWWLVLLLMHWKREWRSGPAK
jgi:hypothetical protein